VRCLLLRVLGQIGDSRAYDTLSVARMDPEPTIQDTAVRALVAWPTTEPIPDLIHIARTSENPTHRILALQGLIRLTGAPSERSAEETLELYGTALELAERADEKKQVLSGLTSLAAPGALDMSMGCLGDNAVRGEAALAALKIAEGLWASHPDRVQAAMETLAGTLQEEEIQKPARALLEKVQQSASKEES